MSGISHADDLGASGVDAETNKRDKNSTYLVSDEVAASLTSKMCGVLHSSHLSSERLEQILLQTFDISEDAPDYKFSAAQFWNANSHKVICSSPTGKYPEQHIFKRAISMKLQEIVLTDFFLDDENNFPIDVNVIQIHPNGSKKTLLDYLNYEIDTALSR